MRAYGKESDKKKLPSLPKQKYFELVFGRLRVRLTVGARNILTEAFRSSFQSLQANAEIKSQISHDCFLQHFQFIIRYHSTIRISELLMSF
jgi:hypothetical protein